MIGSNTGELKRQRLAVNAIMPYAYEFKMLIYMRIMKALSYNYDSLEENSSCERVNTAEHIHKYKAYDTIHSCNNVCIHSYHTTKHSHLYTLNTTWHTDKLYLLYEEFVRSVGRYIR